MLMLLTHITKMGKIFELTLGQGNKVKGQGHIRACVKNWKKYEKSKDKHMLMLLTNITNTD